jgi:hypothetical protein
MHVTCSIHLILHEVRSPKSILKYEVRMRTRRRRRRRRRRSSRCL